MVKKDPDRWVEGSQAARKLEFEYVLLKKNHLERKGIISKALKRDSVIWQEHPCIEGEIKEATFQMQDKALGTDGFKRCCKSMRNFLAHRELLFQGKEILDAMPIANDLVKVKLNSEE
ncbi:hypothetical protein CK203_029286 [Vitis vinifera]|uniref:Uncharacterized protein n=1 Tax=Vitis vinifera TaxID=29760 RepID=A0A438IT19_VITVI|nr:hypothetical protein CK203_029286 [Vitis vinifera]